MKTLAVFAMLFAVALTGCTNSHPARPSSTASQTPTHPEGTDVGTSFPGVNQSAHSPTTATASSDSH